MPPRLWSRYTFTAAFTDPTTGALMLTDRETFPYVELQDNILHTVQEGDTLFSIAATYYRTLPRPAGLWWVIADFQLPPIFDPTLQIAKGTVLVVPSVKTLVTDIFSAARQAEATT